MAQNSLFNSIFTEQSEPLYFETFHSKMYLRNRKTLNNGSTKWPKIDALTINHWLAKLIWYCQRNCNAVGKLSTRKFQCKTEWHVRFVRTVLLYSTSIVTIAYRNMYIQALIQYKTIWTMDYLVSAKQTESYDNFRFI